MINASRNAGTETDPDPEMGRNGIPLPPGIAEFLFLAQTLAAYGWHLAGLLRNPAPWRGFTTVARFFGTVEFVEILPRIQRGLMRAAALEAMLLQRAQRGRDVVFQERSAPKEPPATPPAKPVRGPRSSKAPQPPLTFRNMPSLAEIEAEIRRRPLGSTIAAICLDLGIAPSLCAGPFWNRLFEAMQHFRGSPIAVGSEFNRREKRFESEEWKRRTLPWPERTREGIRQVLGFFIGEDLANPFQPAPAAIAGPS